MLQILRSLAIAGALCIAVPTQAQQAASGAVQANAESAPNVMRPVTPSAWFSRWCGSAQYSFPMAIANASWSCVAGANIHALAGLTSAADKLPYFTGAGSAAVADFTAFARTLVDDADQAAARTTLGVGTADSPQFAGVNVGHASDTTITRVSAGVIAVEGSNVLLASGIGSVTQAWDADLDALAALSSTGLAARTASNTWAQRTLSAPAAGLTITNPAGIAGNPTFALANDLAAVEALSSTGLVRRTGTDTWSAGTAVANSELDTMAAYTIKANATGSSATPTDVSIPALTQKASPVANDIVMIVDSAASNALKYATVSSIASAGSVASLNGQTGALEAYFAPQGRLTLCSGEPVCVTTQSAATSIYYAPYLGDMIPLYNGTNMVPTTFAQISISLGNNWSANTNYDLYVGSDSGTVRLCTGAAWTNNTTRSESLTRTKGIWLNNASMTCRYNNTTTFTCAASRCTYVGSVRIGSSGQTNWIYGASASGGTAGMFSLWNMYNRVMVSSRVTDSGTQYTYTVPNGATRQARASAGNQVAFMSGLGEDGQVVGLSQSVTPAAAAGAFGQFGIGFDTTSAFSCQPSLLYSPTAATNTGNNTAMCVLGVTIGYHTVSANEAGDGTNNINFNGSSAATLSFQFRM